MENNKKIALFIDCENISHEYIDDILNELASYGEVNIRKAYGNWKHNTLKNWDDILLDYALEPIYQKPYNNSKNASDIRMTVDIMKIICKNNNIDMIALATSDSDFTPLIMEIKSEVQVIGFGENKTNNALQKSCSEFKLLSHHHDNIDITKNKKLIKMLKLAIEKTKRDNEFSYISEVGKYLKDRYSDNAKNYGKYNSWADIFKELINIFEIDYIGKNGKRDTMLVKNKSF
jgi:uncharacterized protein (TIGR00288 family)